MRTSQIISDWQAFLTEAVPFNTTWDAYTNPLMHTEIAAQAMRTAYNASHSYWLGLRQQIKNNRSVDLTEFDFSTLSIHKNKATHTLSVPPIYAPENSVVWRDHLVVGITSWQPEEPGQSHPPPTAQCVRHWSSNRYRATRYLGVERRRLPSFANGRASEVQFEV